MSTPFHFLHDDVVVCQHQGTKSSKVLVQQSENEIGERSIEGGNAIREAEPVGEKAPYDLSCFVFVHFHAGPAFMSVAQCG